MVYLLQLSDLERLVVMRRIRDNYDDVKLTDAAGEGFWNLYRCVFQFFETIAD